MKTEPPARAVRFDRDLCRARHENCAEEHPYFSSYEEADFVRTLHGGHGSTCRQWLGSVAYFGGSNANNEDYE
ncbi:hypothetical protein [Nocardia rhamnosiphila]